jgi:methylmalonyl-CoA/ethylmalonyl-CoA epimerase
MKLASNNQKIPCYAAILTAFFLTLPALPAEGQSEAPSEGVGFDLRIDHVGISVADLEESVNWYVEKLGFELVRPIDRTPDSPLTIARIRRGNFTIELFEIEGAAPLPDYRRDPSADLRVHGLAHFAFEVDDAVAVMKELESKGVEIVLRPREDDVGATFFFVRDNSGNSFEFIQRPSP